ncbi:unnamed protein product, partial [Polarella glacialis]
MRRCPKESAHPAHSWQTDLSTAQQGIHELSLLSQRLAQRLVQLRAPESEQQLNDERRQQHQP